MIKIENASHLGSHKKSLIHNVCNGVLLKYSIRFPHFVQNSWQCLLERKNSSAFPSLLEITQRWKVLHPYNVAITLDSSRLVLLRCWSLLHSSSILIKSGTSRTREKRRQIDKNEHLHSFPFFYSVESIAETKLFPLLVLLLLIIEETPSSTSRAKLDGQVVKKDFALSCFFQGYTSKAKLISPIICLSQLMINWQRAEWLNASLVDYHFLSPRVDDSKLA